MPDEIRSDPPNTADHAQLYELLISELTDFTVVLLDVEGRFANWNAGVAGNLGYSKEEFIGQPLALIFTPEDRAAGTPQREIALAAERGRATDIRWHVRKDGSRLYVEGVLVSLRDESGKLLGFSKVIRDITARKLYEERLEQLTRALKQAQVIVRSLDGTVHVWSDGAERLYGYTQKDAAGRHAHEMLQTEFPQPLEEIEAALHESGVWHGELRHIRSNGERITVTSDWILHRDASGSRGLVIEASTDVTALKRIEEKLLRANDELLHFGYAASHDLQEPLRTIRSYSELLARYEDRLDEEGKNFLHTIQRGGERMGRLLEDLLSYSRTGEALMREVSASDVLASALLNLKAAIEESQAQITHDLLPVVYADPAHLMELFQNLISNAIKYRSAEPPHIDIAVRSEGEHWLFSVHDNGGGFDQAYAQQIFQPFKRLHGHSVAGTGMGLAICKRIVERRGGAIWAESEPGRGSTFYFTVPQSPGTSEESPCEG